MSTEHHEHYNRALENDAGFSRKIIILMQLILHGIDLSTNTAVVFGRKHPQKNFETSLYLQKFTVLYSC